MNNQVNQVCNRTNSNPETSNQRGFSLVELMVALAVIGVLVSMASSSYTRFKQYTHDAIVKYKLRNIHIHIQGQEVENQNYTLHNHSNCFNTAHCSAMYPSLGFMHLPDDIEIQMIVTGWTIGGMISVAWGEDRIVRARSLRGTGQIYRVDLLSGVIFKDPSETWYTN